MALPWVACGEAPSRFVNGHAAVTQQRPETRDGPTTLGGFKTKLSTKLDTIIAPGVLGAPHVNLNAHADAGKTV